MAKRDSQQASLASFEVDRAIDLIENDDWNSARDALEQASKALHEMSRSKGVSVSIASQSLGVSEPTVRRWISRGVLRSLPGTSPIEIEIQEVMATRLALNALRADGQDRDWLQALVDYFEDRDTRGQSGVGKKKQFNRGDYVPA